MQLPHSKTRATYIDRMKVIEANLRDATSGELDHVLLSRVQKQVDGLASKYQYSEEIGTARYKLYELQALVHYFNGNDSDALDFINQAIETRGDNYSRAEKLKVQLLARIHSPNTADHKSLSKQERRKKLIGIEGWLAWYVVGLFIGAGITSFNFFNGGVSLSSSDIEGLNQYQNGLGYTFSTLTTFENIALVTYIVLLVSTIVLIIRKKKLAKAIAIITMIFGAVYATVDYAVASSLFDSSNLTQYVQSELHSAAGYAGRNILVAFVWVPYFLLSKRVKATLIE